MSKVQLRNRRGVLLGTIDTQSNGKQILRDKRGVLKGNYDPKTNQTRDRSGKLVAKGNLLTTLLVDINN
jgi:hypothetical protein